jgi:hypothetical protein
MKSKICLFLCILSLSSCVTYQKCIEKFNIKTDSIRTVIYRDTIVPVYIPKTDTLYAWANIHDTLIVHSGTAHAESYVVHDTLKLNIWQSDTLLKIKIDSCIKIIDNQKTTVLTITKKARLEKILLEIIIGLGIVLLIILIPRILKKK